VRLQDASDCRAERECRGLIGQLHLQLVDCAHAANVGAKLEP
jgi:hypothetical protein